MLNVTTETFIRTICKILLYNNVNENNQIMGDSSHLPSCSSNKTLSILSRYFLIISISSLMIVMCVLFLYVEPEILEKEQNVMRHLGELHMRERHLNLGFRMLKEETSLFFYRLNNMLSDLPLNYTANPEVQRLMKNISKVTSSHLHSLDMLKPPNIFHFLPHLLFENSSLQPYYRLSRNRTGVSVIIGIPSVQRQTQSYLLTTLNDLIQKMNAHERNDTLIVVFIAEIDTSYVLQVASEIKNQFVDEVESGLIDIISPPASFYPDFEKLPSTLSDPVERVRWRSKQSLDFAFLMMYSYSKGMFYIQLEDDILARPNYLSIMKNVALTKVANNQRWFVLDFCQLGFIGKMFRCVDLPWIIQFFLMFYNDKPVDWLLDGLIQTKVCNLEKDSKDCKNQKDKMWIHNKPSLFQHIGTTSSLKGKVQKLKDTHFGKIPLFVPHSNPPAEVSSSLKPYKQHTLNRAYLGKTFFWGLMPRPSDWIAFKFKKPIKLKKYKFKSGNLESPSDKLYNTSIMARFISNTSNLPSVVSHKLNPQSNNTAYVTIGNFNNLGIAEREFDDKVGAVKELRLVIHNGSKNWVVLSEILIEDFKR